VEFEYERKGTASLLAAFHTGSGHVVGRCFSKLHDEKNDSKTFISFIEDLMRRYPKKRYGKLYIVLDNGSSHRSHETTAFFEEHKARLKPVFVPVHGSWLNQVEIFFSVLSRRVLRHSSYDSVPELIKGLYAYIDLHNHHKKHPYKWTYQGRPLTL
jgi:transposase